MNAPSEYTTQTPVYEDWFEEQFANRQTPIIPGQNCPDEHLTVVEVTPPFLSDPANRAKVVVAPGLMSGIEIQKGLIHAIASRGHDVAALDHSVVDRGVVHDLPYHGSLVQNAEDLFIVADHLGYEEFDVLAHSMGFITGVIGAIRSSRIRRLVGVSPAGINRLGVDDMARGPLMFLQAASQMSSRPNVAEMAAAVAKKFRANPGRHVSEMLSLRHTTVIDDLGDVTERTSVGVLVTRADPVISEKRLLRSLRQKKVELDAVATYAQRAAGHMAIIIDRGAQDAAIEMLENLPVKLQPEDRVLSLSA